MTAISATICAVKTFAIVIPTTWNAPVRWSVDVDLMVQGFLECGQEVVVVCAEGSDLTQVATDRSRIRVVSLPRMVETCFWQSLGVDAALIFTWMGRPDIVRAARNAGLFTVSLSDSDGLHGVRVYPQATLRRMVLPMPTALEKLRACWHWSKKFAYLYRTEEAEFVQSVQLADVTTVQMMEAKTRFRRFLAHQQCVDCDDKVRVVPFPINAAALNAPLVPKQNHLVAVARWDDPQKNAPLLAQSLQMYLQASPDTVVTLIGRGGEAPFASLLRTCKQVCYTGALPREEVAQILQTARTIVFTSRWEGMPIALQEALALGCSVVGTDIPALRSVCESGPFGTLAAQARPHAVMDALQAEHRVWQSGERDPQTIAAFWRARLSPQYTAQMYLDLLENHD